MEEDFAEEVVIGRDVNDIVSVVLPTSILVAIVLVVVVVVAASMLPPRCGVGEDIMTDFEAAAAAAAAASSNRIFAFTMDILS